MSKTYRFDSTGNILVSQGNACRYTFDSTGNITGLNSSKKRKKKHNGLKIAIKMFCVMLIMLITGYCTFIFAEFKPISSWRQTYIQMAMGTLNHKWLATSFIPEFRINEAMQLQRDAAAAMEGIESSWDRPDSFGVDFQFLTPVYASEVVSADTESVDNTDNADATLVTPDDGITLTYEQKKFFDKYWMIDKETMLSTVEEYPYIVENGWNNIDIDQSGLDQSGTSIYTIYGDQVLALNTIDGVVLIRINVGWSRGILAFCMNTKNVHNYAATTLPVIGQLVGEIVDDHNGVLGINGSAFMDDGSSNGGQISGLGVCNGEVLGERLGWGAKRLELRGDNYMYIVDSNSELDDSTRDACEFQPAVIIDGKVIVDEDCGWTGANPRTILGQCWDGSTMMLVLEGRLASSPGCSVVPLAELMVDYYCAQALNLDGGTSSMMYYKGRYINRCSNTDLYGGRTLPTAWVYTGQ